MFVGGRAATVNLGVVDPSSAQTGRSPRIGKRELQQQRRSRTMASLDDTVTIKKQKPMRASDELKVCRGHMHFSLPVVGTLDHLGVILALKKKTIMDG